MENHTEARKSPEVPVKATKDESLVSEAETAAAKDEPMGSIASAVPGNDAAAEDGLAPGSRPGAEETDIEREAGPTAGTEFPADNGNAPAGKDGAGEER
jgi:hypothetical protein